MTIKEKILKIMSLALEINPPERNNGGKIKASVSVCWLPHENDVMVKICFDGYKDGVSTIDNFAVSINPKVGSKGLNKIISRLEALKMESIKTEMEDVI